MLNRVEHSRHAIEHDEHAGLAEPYGRQGQVLESYCEY